jgi:hypothetical protein
MEQITVEYLTIATAWLLITTILFFIMDGAGIYETAVIVPRWSMSPPESFQLFKKPYGVDLKTFWIVMHSLHEVAFILTIIFSWKIDTIRNWLLILFVIHFLTRIWTLVYFAPNIIEFQKIANAPNQPNDLLQKAIMWRRLNYIRTGISILVSIGFIPLCIQILSMRLK